MSLHVGQATLTDSNCVRDARKGITEETKSQRLSTPLENFLLLCVFFFFLHLAKRREYV